MITNKQTSLQDYEDFLLGKSKMIFHGTAEEKEESAKALFRYAIEYLLGWTPEEAGEHLTPALIEKLGLDVAMKHIRFPKDLNPNEDYDYIVAVCYGLPFDPRKQTDRMMDRILAGKVSKFPKGYADGDTGNARLRYLVARFIAENIPATSVENLYEMFSDYSAINQKMREKEIYDIYHNRYRDPLTLLHNVLPGDQQDQFYYSVYQYMTVIQAIAKNEEKKDRGE